MKSFIIVLLLSVFAIPSFSQIKKVEEKVASEEIEKLPEIVIKRVGKDFSVYLPDSNNPEMDVRKLEEKLVSYDLGKDEEGSDEYLVVMELNNSTLAATYNANGKLIGVVENYKNVRLPAAVIHTIYKNYPDWKIVKDKFLYSQEDGDITKKQYTVKIKKEKIEGDTKKLIVYPNGEIIKASE